MLKNVLSKVVHDVQMGGGQIDVTVRTREWMKLGRTEDIPLDDDFIKTLRQLLEWQLLICITCHAQTCQENPRNKRVVSVHGQAVLIKF